MTQPDEKFASVPAHLQAELLRRLAGESASEERPIPTVPRDGLLPMSSAQERLWFLAELEPDSAEYNTLRALRLRGDLDTAALTAALDQVVRRHETLRTTFDAPAGRGVQVVHEHTAQDLPTVDVSGPGAEAAVERFLATEMNEPFDLRHGPLLRATLLRVDDREHVLVLAMHHIVCDGWSTGRLLGELAAGYEAAVGGTTAALPPVPVQYADYAAWERERAAGLDEELAHWRDRLAGMRTVELPTDRPRPPVRTPAGATLPVEIPADVLDRLRELSRGQDATLFMALVTVTKVLLARYCGETDVAVGTVTLGRQRPELENLIGFFINTVVLRSQVDESLSFTELLGRVRTGLLEAFAHDEVPFQRLVEALRPDRDASRPPLVQVMVNLQNMADTLPAFRGLDVTEIQPPVDVAKLDLTFDFYEDASSLVCYLEYSTDLFDRATVERLGGHLVTLLRAVAEESTAPLAGLSMLPADELRTLTADWQGPALEVPAARTLHEIFDEQAARTPDSVAVSDGSRRLTFAELAERANRLAHHLVAAGVRPGVLTGVCLDRGVDAMVALLAVLKAGGAFVPLDPEHPAGRLAMMLEDAATPVLITDSTAVGEGPWTTVRLDTDQDAIARRPATPPVTAAGPDDLAYVVYTSGSTGRPKGVMVSHRNAAHMMRAWDDRYDLTGLRGRSLSVSSLAVDLFLGDFLMSAMYGGEMVICPAEVITDPPALAALISEVRPQLLVTTPSLAKAIAQELSWTGGRADSLRVLAVGSEAWLADDAAAVLELLSPDAVVTNNYGATETTVDSTTYRLRAGEPVGTAIVPVGRPLGNTRTYVLDSRLRPVPVGVPGEIHIGGDGVAQGYWNRPELTAQRFLDDPFTGGRLYRTGDIGRWRPDGDVEYLGRADDQVKVRGFRVELGEVEAAMLRHPGIAAAAAAVRPDPAGRDRLVGYLTADGTAPTLTELRAFLAGIVPDPAIPSALVVLDELPMTPSGTLDRKALPTPTATDHAPAGHVPPRDRTESELAAIWAEVLGLAPGTVGADDNFFELGGDSIVGLQVVSKARRAGLRLTAKQIFQYQTVADLAAVVRAAEERAAEERAGDGRAPRTPATAVGDVPLTPVQHWYFEQYPRGAGHFNQSMFVELAPGTDPAALRTAVTALLDHHDALRLRAVPADGSWRQHCAPAETGEPFRTVDLSGLDREARERAVHEAVTAAQTGFRLDTGPLLAAVLLTGAPGPDRLFVTAHHLVVDGVTWRVLLSDLELAHEQAARGLPVGLPEKTTSFREWSRRLTEAAASGRFDDERPYWQAVEAASTTCPPLPGDTTAPLPADGAASGTHAHAGVAPDAHADTAPDAHADTLARARTVEAGLDAELTRALLRDVPAAYRTQVNDVLLTALAAVLTEWTGGDAVAVELEGHGRENLFDDVDLSRTAGWFTTLFPVVLPVPGEDWGTRIKAVKETLRAVPEAGIGYGALRHLTANSGLGGARCQVGFNYHGHFDVATGDGLLRAWQPSPVPDRGADLTRPNLLEVTGMVRDGRLEFSWEYSAALHDEATIAGLAERFTTALADLVAHCSRAGGCTPSDFPLAGLDQAGVDRIAGDGRTVEDVYPLTPMQSGLLFHSLDAHEEDIYLTHVGLVLDGVPDPALLVEAWQRVVDRTPVLRTAIADAEGGRPLQVVHRDVRVPAVIEDWSELTEAQQQDRIRLLAEAPSEPLDLSRPPLLRLHLARLSASAVHLRCSSHHLLLDGWSFADVLGEVFAEHAALRGREVAPPRPRRPFREYVRWLGEQDTAAAQAYWTGLLAGFSAPTALPYDRPPLRSHQSRDTGHIDLALTAEETGRLEGFAREARVTVNTLIQGAWALLLSRYSGDRQVCFGTTVGGRPAELPGSDGMVGLFINTLPARLTVSPDRELRAWLREIQEQQVDGRQFAYASLAQVRNWAAIPAGTDLFDSCVVFENFPYDEHAAERHGLEVRSLVGLETSNFPLTCVAHLVDGLHLRLGYDPRLFDDDTAGRFADHLLGILDAMVAAPDAVLRDLPTVRGAERHRLVEEFNGTPSGYPERCLHELFAEVAREHPDRFAVVAGDTRLTYAELDARSDRLAHDLVGRGVGPEVPVGICLPGGAEMITAMLGVLKAGGAYVPLDPGYPSERLAYLFRDSGVPVLLTSAALAPGLPPTGAEILFVDDLRPGPVTGPPPSRTVPDNLAVLVYTSGSTGVPKAGMVTHRGLVRLVRAAGEHTFGDAATIAQHHSISFDAAQNELWQALLSGACLAVRPGDFRSVDELDKFLRDHEVQAMSFAAGFFHAVADTDPGILAGLRKVVVGGEALSAPHCARVLDRLPDLRIVNAYGPTECSVTATCFPVERGGRPGRTVPVGRPTADTRVYLFDRDLQVVPVGVAGEAYLAGDGVSRGYRDRPAMTAERFLPDPFGKPGSRMYRTGDLMRWRPDGTLEFVGRTDDQVKLRGYRIELGEIEQALAEHPDVARAAVVVREDQPGRRRLVGYVVSEQDPAELTSYLASRLPEYMVPAALVRLDRIPLTPHGKVDRRALPEPATAAAGRASVEPRTPDERTMAAIWAEVLGVERVGVTDDFFDLGGDSILSIQVVFKSRRAGLQVSSSDLFRHPTVERLVAAAGRDRRVAATQRAEAGEVPLTPIQYEFFARNTVAPHHLAQSVHVELAADTDETALRAALAAVVAHHDALRMRYVRDERGRWSQRNAEAETGELFERHDLSGLPDEELPPAMDRLAAAADTGFDLAEGPLLRAVLFDLGPDRRPHLHLTVHHLVIDAVSWRILNHDLDLAYRQALAGEPVDLGAKTSSFRQWATRLAAHAADGGFADQAAHWDAVPEAAPLPTDGPGPNVVSSRRIMPVRLERDETEVLLRVAPGRFRARASDVLLSALAWTMCRWSGEDRLVIEMEGHGREEIFDDIDLSRTVGWFTSSYPVALEVPGRTDDEADWPAVVRSVRRCLRAVPGNGLGHGALRHLAGAGAPAAEHTPPAVLFNYHSQTEEITRTADRSLFHAFHEPIGREQDERERVVQALEVVGAVEDGRLGFDLYYSVNLHEPGTIERVGAELVAALRSVARLCEPALGTGGDR
ncbi:amino acid adenylation domain-containing protein [Streptomyces litmocidini]|uniref:amino acid adenylation domain-containing protein n=1 Tax=Streptomyces litmocidini TaxID=67318 RepID=UPI0033FA0573